MAAPGPGCGAACGDGISIVARVAPTLHPISPRSRPRHHLTRQAHSGFSTPVPEYDDTPRSRVLRPVGCMSADSPSPQGGISQPPARTSRQRHSGCGNGHRGDRVEVEELAVRRRGDRATHGATVRVSAMDEALWCSSGNRIKWKPSSRIKEQECVLCHGPTDPSCQPVRHAFVCDRPLLFGASDCLVSSLM